MKWNKKLWGVKFVPTDQAGFLISTFWHEEAHLHHYHGGPTRPLLFTTRNLARQWCKTRIRSCVDKKYCTKLKFIPVRVSYLVKII